VPLIIKTEIGDFYGAANESSLRNL